MGSKAERDREAYTLLKALDAAGYESCVRKATAITLNNDLDTAAAYDIERTLVYARLEELGGDDA